VEDKKRRSTTTVLIPYKLRLRGILAIHESLWYDVVRELDHVDNEALHPTVY